MSYDIIATSPFEKELKRLAKKYKSLVNDLERLISELEEKPTIGTLISEDCYKIRLAISSKGKGKSGGARLITYVRVVKQTVYLLTIYDKSEYDSISKEESRSIIKNINIE